MKILEFKHARDIPEELIPSLHRSEVECWGQEPFSEYKICNDCKAIFSIEEVHGSIENFRNHTTCGDDFECKECSGETKYIYKTEDFVEKILEYYKNDVSAILLMSNENSVEGFGFLSKTNTTSIVENEFNTRPNSYQKIDLYNKIKSEIGEDLLCFHQLYINKTFRDTKLFFDFTKKLFLANKEFMDIPIVLETMFESRFYPIGRMIGFNNLLTDRYGYVIQAIKNYWEFMYRIEKDLQNNNDNLNLDILKYKRESRNVLMKQDNFKKRVFYN